MRGETLPSAFANGKAPSRDIEYIIRAPEVWQASVQAKTATATQQSSSRPSTLPSRSVSTQDRPSEERLPSVRLGAAISAARISRPPPRPEVVSARMIVFGVVLRGAWVSSASSPAESKPTMTYAAISPEASQAKK